MRPFVSASPGVLTLQLSAVVGWKPWALSGTSGQVKKQASAGHLGPGGEATHAGEERALGEL